jgi:chromosome transmission fidelity protein 4
VLLNSWDGSKEWSVDLPEGEEALAVAAGKGWFAVATDTRNLRLFTVAGTQREVVSLSGPVVCVAGSGNRLLAIFHNGMGEYPRDSRFSEWGLIRHMVIVIVYLFHRSYLAKQ